jgi:hypothetical protein
VKNPLYQVGWVAEINTAIDRCLAVLQIYCFLLMSQETGPQEPTYHNPEELNVHVREYTS